MTVAEPACAEQVTLLAPVAVVLSRFPLVTETFVLRELVEMRRQGVPVVLVPLLREEPATVHDAARPWIDRALYTPFLDAASLLALLRALARRPGTILGAAWRARGDRNALAGLAGILPKSARNARTLRALGVRHVHAQFATHPAMSAFLMARLGRGLSWSVTVHAHDLFVSQAGLRAKLEAAKFVRCISEFNARWLEERVGLPRARCRVIHCGIDPGRHARDPEPGLPGRERPARLLSVAALKEYKGLTHLVEAVRLLEQGGVRATCDVIGGGPLRPGLEAQAAAAGLSDRVRFVGTRTEAEVAAALARCDVFVLPSVIAADGQMEGIPVALMEALAARLPVVTTRLSGIPELVRDGETGWLVPPGDAAALAAAVRDALERPDEARRRGERGRELVEREFEIRRVTGELLDALGAHGAATDAPEWARELAVASARAAGLPPGARFAGVLRWHEGRDARHVELSLPALEGDEPRRVLAKQHLDPPQAGSPSATRARREHEALAVLHAQGLAVPRPVALEAERRLVVMEVVEGRPADPLRAHELRAAGAWLRALGGAEGPPRDPAAFARDAVAARLLDETQGDGVACVARGIPAGLVDRAREACRAALPPLARETAACWTHGDYWPGNVLAEGGEARVLDLEGLRPGLLDEDAANFLEHLALSTRLLVGRASAERAFLEGLRGPGALPRPPARELRLAKLLRLAARAPALEGGGLRRAWLSWRVSARLEELLGP